MGMQLLLIAGGSTNLWVAAPAGAEGVDGSGERSAAREPQGAAQPVVIARDVFQRRPIEHLEVGLQASEKTLRAPAHPPGDPAIAGRAEALHDGEVRFHGAHHVADADRGGVAGQFDAA